MPNIHHTAIIESGAKLHDSVTVGAYCVIGAHVTIDAGSIIHNHSSIQGHTIIGKNNKIFPFASVGELPQDKKYNNEITTLTIGDNNIIREFVTIHLGTITGNKTTIIGNNNMFLASSHVAHDCIIGNNVIFSNSVAVGGYVTVKDWVTFGAGTLVHQFVVVGEHVMTSGATGVDRDIPPYTMVFGYRAEPRGINHEGLKRRGFTVEQVENIKHAYKVLYRNDLLLNDAKNSIVELSQTQPELLLYNTFFTQSTRGIIR